MKQYLSYISQYEVYPGEYSPMPGTEALLRELKTKDDTSKPLVNMDEMNDCYKVKVAIPGARREDIFLNIDENILSIAVLKQQHPKTDKENKIHEFDSNNFERHLLLPKYGDAIFINAEYKAGILYIYIPKSKNPVRNLRARVVVY